MSLVDKNIKEQYRLKKEYKKKWKEEELMKKMVKKQKDQKISESLLTTNTSFIPTISIAVPGSLLNVVESDDMKSYIASEIARYACIYNIDEIIVFDDEANAGQEDEDKITPSKHSCLKLGRILQYLECPQYLRKHFFPSHPDLNYAGILIPLDAPHHLRMDENFLFREGITTKKFDTGTLVNVGLSKDIYIDQDLEPNQRVTVKLIPSKGKSNQNKGIIVSPLAPKFETGTYWGYNCRIAKNFLSIISDCPYKEVYDLMIGTSDKGKCIDEIKSFPQYKHAIIVFGGSNGLESVLKNESTLPVHDPHIVFDFYLNTCPSQGSRIIETDEAILLTLVNLRKLLHPT